MNVGNKHTRQSHDHQMISRLHPQPHQYPRFAQTAVDENGRVLYAPLRMLPPSVAYRPRPCAEFNGSDHYRFVPDMHPHTSYRQGEHLSQDKKRSEADNAPQMACKPCPLYHPGFRQDNQQMFAATRDLSQEQPNSASSRNDVRPYALWRPEDEERVSGSNHYGSSPAANPHAPNPERKGGLKAHDGVQTMIHLPYPSYPPEVSHTSERGFQRDSQNIFRQEKPNSAASRNDVRPPLLGHPEDEERVSGSSHYGSRPPTNHRVPNPESEYIYQDRTRPKVVDGVQTMIHQPYPSFPPSYPPEVSHTSERGFRRDNQQIFRQEKPNSAASRNDVRPRSLWRPEDEERASGSSRHGSEPDTNPKAPYPESECILQDRKRLKVDDGVQTIVHQPFPSYSPKVSHPSESRKGVRSRSLWCLEEERVICSNHYGSGPDTNLNAPNPVSLSFDQDRKRLEVDDGKRTMVRQPCSIYQPQVAHASEHALAPMAGEQRNEKTDSSNGERPHLLWVPEDEQHLTELHCFVRKHCVFIFCATRKDVGSKFNDENDSQCRCIYSHLVLLSQLQEREGKRH